MLQNFIPPPTQPPPGVSLTGFLGRGKSGYSYLALIHNTQVVYKAMHAEEVTYYHFSKPKTALEAESYKVLQQAGVPVPRLIDCNHEKQYLIKEFIDGPVVPDLLLNQPAEPAWLITLLMWEQRLMKAGINIDYFPTNFVVHNQKLWYVDYEHNPYSEEYNFRNWGIWYWLNHEGFNTFTLTGNASAINLPESGKPHVTPEMRLRRDEILRSFDRPNPNR